MLGDVVREHLEGHRGSSLTRVLPLEGGRVPPRARRTEEEPGGEGGTGGRKDATSCGGSSGSRVMAAIHAPEPSAPAFPAVPPPSYEEISGTNNSAPYPHPNPDQGLGSAMKMSQPPPYTVPSYPQHPQVHAGPLPAVYIQSSLVFRNHPVQMCCPACGNMIVTRLSHSAGTLSWLACGGLFLLGCWAGCCLIPFCVDDLLDVEHFCPSCNTLLGVYKRI